MVGLWKVLRKWGYLVSNKFSFFVGNGKRIKFWKDSCCGGLGGGYVEVGAW